jgi:hypothetical protein
VVNKEDFWTPVYNVAKYQIPKKAYIKFAETKQEKQQRTIKK